MEKKRTRPRDTNLRALDVVQHATEGALPPEPPEPEKKEPEKDPLAVELGRRGGLKGGKARAAKLSAEERSAIAKKAAAARWSRPKPSAA